jgi:hypothetical protein
VGELPKLFLNLENYHDRRLVIRAGGDDENYRPLSLMKGAAKTDAIDGEKVCVVVK